MLLHAVEIAYCVFFLHVIFSWEGHIFYGVSKWCKKNKVPEFVQKPLFACSICMSFWWGIGLQYVFYDAIEFKFMVYTAFIAGGINAINEVFARFYSKIK